MPSPPQARVPSPRNGDDSAVSVAFDRRSGRTLRQSWAFLMCCGAVVVTVGVIGTLNTRSDVLFERERAYSLRADNLGQIGRSLASDPSDAEYPLIQLAIGDWGPTIEEVGASGDPYGGWGSRIRNKPYPEYGSDEWNRNFYSQNHLAYLMSQSVDKLGKVDSIISIGDLFYWDGVSSAASPRFESTFESVYNYPNMIDIPWYHVLGNHDVGGAAYICNTDRTHIHGDDSVGRPCTGPEEVLQYLDYKLEAIRDYKSPNNDRWKFGGAYYTSKHEAGGVSVEVFHVDTNWADSHGGEHVCCQCYSYKQALEQSGVDVSGIECNNVHRGHDACAPTDIFDACMDRLQEWWDEGIQGLKKDLKSSKADWKIINTHYHLYHHMGPEKRKQWEDVFAGLAHVWVCGHTHSEAHDYIGSKGYHILMSGAGGGIQHEGGASVDTWGETTLWAEGDYGFMELSYSKDFLKAEFIGLDHSTWSDYGADAEGGAASMHCAYIPRSGGQGCPCDNPSGCEIRRSSTPPETEPTAPSGSNSGASDDDDDGASSSAGSSAVDSQTSNDEQTDPDGGGSNAASGLPVSLAFGLATIMALTAVLL